MNTERHVKAYNAAWRRITQGACSRLSDGSPTNARAMAQAAVKLASPPPRSGGPRTGVKNVKGGGHNKRKPNPNSEAVFAIFGKGAARG